MKIIKFNIILCAVLLLTSCDSIKKGFSGNKKNNSDEFLVEKKSPLIMPPDYNELPVPKEGNVLKENGQNEIKSLISKQNKKEINKNSEEKNSTFEELILNKIKNK
jgi:transcriptional regulatory protein LevR